MNSEVFVIFAFFISSILYSSVGHAGASAYLAVMAFSGFVPETIKPTALLLNLVVASVASYNYFRHHYFDWKLFWPLAVFSIPMAFLGARIIITPFYFKILIGISLIFAAFRLVIKVEDVLEVIHPSKFFSFLLGGTIGFLSGLTGVGGGIFLTPALIFKKTGPVKIIAAISAVFIFVNSTAGILGNLSGLKHLPENMILFTVTVIVGGWFGSHYGSVIAKNKVLRQILALILVSAGIKMVLF